MLPPNTDCLGSGHRCASLSASVQLVHDASYDEHQQTDNKMARAFGINGIPHMLLLDRKGCLRFDRVRGKAGFEEKLLKLLAEEP